MKCCVLGTGTWGSALAQVLCDNGHQVVAYGIEETEVNDINLNHKNTRYFGDDVIFSDAFKATLSLEEAMKDAEVYVLAVPTFAIRGLLNKMKPLIQGKPYFVSVAKGFDPSTLMRMSEVIRDIIPASMRQEVVSLIGPGHAEEVVVRKLTAITSTCIDEETAKFVQNLFANPYFRVYVQTDEIGAEYGVAIKNAIAIASGITQGIGMGDNAKAALATRGLVEMIRFGTKMGGQTATFIGLTGIGDLMVTCNSVHSRNYQAGYEIGKCGVASTFLKNNTKTVEGIRTAEIVYNIAKQHNIDMPIVKGVYEVLFNDRNPREVVYELMTRELKKE